MATGVRSFQLKGMPVASGVVKRFDRVMMILCGLPCEALTSRKPSPPAPPALLITTIGCLVRLCLVTMPWMVRAMMSAPPPVPAGMMNSIGRVGSQADRAGAGARAEPRTNADAAKRPNEYVERCMVTSSRLHFLSGLCRLGTRHSPNESRASMRPSKRICLGMHNTIFLEWQLTHLDFGGRSRMLRCNKSVSAK